MSKWDNRFSTHAIHETLKNLGEALDNIDVEDDEELAAVGRLKSVKEHLTALLERCDPELVTGTTLDLMQQGASGMLSEIRAWEQDEAAGHFDNANAQADQALDGARGLLVIVADKQVDALRKSATAYRQSMAQLAKAMEKDATGAKSNYTKALEEIKTAKDDFDTKRDAVQQGLDDLAAEIANQKTALATTTTQFDTDFKNAEEARETTFKDALKAQDDAFKQASDKHGADAEKAVTDLQEHSAELVKELEDMKARAEKLVGVIGSTGMSGGFQQYANQQRRAANWWSWGVMLPLLAIVGVALWLISEAHGQEDVELASSLAKVFVSLPLAAIAGYSAQQASRHRHNEQQARQLELDLASIDPFITPLPDEEQYTIKKEIAQRVFGRPVLKGDAQQLDKIGANQLIDLLRDAIKFLGGK